MGSTKYPAFVCRVEFQQQRHRARSGHLVKERIGLVVELKAVRLAASSSSRLERDANRRVSVEFIASFWAPLPTARTATSERGGRARRGQDFEDWFAASSRSLRTSPGKARFSSPASVCMLASVWTEAIQAACHVVVV